MYKEGSVVGRVENLPCLCRDSPLSLSPRYPLGRHDTDRRYYYYFLYFIRRFCQIGKGKEGCGRVVVRKQLGIVNAYTMEASFMGADQVQ